MKNKNSFKRLVAASFVVLALALAAVGIDLFFTRARLIDAQTAPHMNLGEPLPANLFVELAKAINPSVVNISSAKMPHRLQMRRGPNPWGNDPFFEMFEDMFQGQQMMPSRPEQSLGTGFIIRPEGLILTNNHVVEGADVIKVQLSEKDKTLYTAKLIGRDQRSDIALIKIDAKKTLPAVKLGTSADLQVGEWVAAFGNPLGLGHTTSKGIISAIGREIEDLNRFPFLQTDASINPGNSGGPLANIRGEVIGVNTAIAAGSQGIGFAIPIDAVKPIIETLEKGGKIRHGFLGIQLYPYPLSPQQAKQMGLGDHLEGAMIVGVVEGSAAAKAGLKEYDFVTKFDGRDVNDSGSLTRMISDAEVGKSYEIDLLRKGKPQKITVTLAENTGEHGQVRQLQPKEHKGVEATGFGFKITNYNPIIAEEFNLPKLKKNYPIVVEVEPDSQAARAQLSVGDVIVDVNQQEVTSEGDVLKHLKKGEINSIRVLRGGYPMLLYLSPK
jgi:serine protease Do